jgi:hypothetical protein
MNASSFFDMTDDPAEPAGGCNGCTACCTIMGVAELNKDRYITCQHVCESGCAIYEARPESCREWACLWRRGVVVGGEDYRPDRLGIVWDISDPERTGDGNLFGVQCLIAHVASRAAADAPRARYMLEKAGRQVPIVLRGPDFIRLYGPPALLRHATQRAAEMAGYTAESMFMPVGP